MTNSRSPGKQRQRNPASAPGNAIQSVERAVGLLRAVVKGGRDGRRLTDLASDSGLSKSTVHRMMGALIAAGLVDQDQDTKQFCPGIELFRLGSAAADRFSVVEFARPALERLADAFGDTAFLSIPIGQESLCVDRRIGAFPIKALTVEIGDRRPLGIGSGSMALLAYRRNDEVEAAISANRPHQAMFAGFDPAMLRQLVAATRRQGYSFIEGQLIEGMSAVGVPILDHRGRAIAALSVAAISGRLQPSRRRSVVSMLKAQARLIEQRLAQLGAGAAADRLAS